LPVKGLIVAAKDKNYFTNIFTALAYYGISPDTKLKKVTQKNISYFLISHQKYGITASLDICQMPEYKKDKQIYKTLIEYYLSLLIFNLNSVNAIPRFIFTTLSFPEKTPEDSVSSIFGIINRIASSAGLLQAGGLFQKNRKKHISLNLSAYGETAESCFLNNLNPVSDSTIYYTGNVFADDLKAKTTDTDNLSRIPKSCLLNRLENQELNDIIFKSYNPYYIVPASYSLIKIMKDIIQSNNACEINMDDLFPNISNFDNNDTDMIKILLNGNCYCGLFFISTKRIDQKFYNSFPITPIGSISGNTTKPLIKIKFKKTLLETNRLEDIL